jgi:cell division protein FtsI (penicillin-binding protein 3)
VTKISSRSSESRFYFSAHARLSFLRFLVVSCFIVLASRLVYVQGFLRNDLERKATRQIPTANSDTFKRGRLLDRNGIVLAETVPVYSCFVDPSILQDKRAAASLLADVLGLNEAALYKKINVSKNSFVWIMRNVPAQRAQEIKSKAIRGISFRTEYRRHYPLGPIASHLVGLVGHEGTGLCGVEQAFEGTLQSGDVQLTIDGSIQQIVERELYWGVDKTGAKRAMAAVQDPRTGEILALASWPPLSLNPEEPSNPKEMRIPELVDVFEPGSTFKVVLAAAAIEENLIRSGERFSGENGQWKVADIKIHDHEPRGLMTFDEVMMYSSNIGVAKIAERLGSQRLYQYARLFGFGVYPGSGLACEAKGTLRAPSQWSGVSKYVVSFGQEVGATAMQITGAYSAIANGGMLMEPKIIKRVLPNDEDPGEEAEPVVVRRIITPDTSKELTRMLVRVVEEGTGLNARVRYHGGIKVAGKTGTAQKFVAAKKRYDEHLTVVSFAGFFPADAPRYTMLIVLDEPQGRRWGGTDAAPVFQRIAEQLAPRLFSDTDNKS